MVYLGFYGCSLGILGREWSQEWFQWGSGKWHATCLRDTRGCNSWFCDTWWTKTCGEWEWEWNIKSGIIDEAKGDKLGNCRWLQAESSKNGTAWEGSGNLIWKLTDVTKKNERTATYRGWPILQKTARVLCSVVVSSHPCWAFGTDVHMLPEFVLPNVMQCCTLPKPRALPFVVQHVCTSRR